MNPIDTNVTDNDTEQLKHRRIRSFVLRMGRMTTGQQRAMDELWPRFGIDYTPARLDLDAVFGRQAPRMVEIGFGTGEALFAYAQTHREMDCLGIEVHRPGAGHLLLQVESDQTTNIRASCHDAVEVLTHQLGAASIDAVHIFFPDPWHKSRHHKRRLIQTAFADLLARVLKPGGVLRLATDWENYAEHMRAVLDIHPQFNNLAGDTGYMPRPDDRPLTRFERRGHRLGHGVWDMAYQRR
ncbi:MAG: tRNA (guanosine(46)-N7)-methyltransferase TrmB [Steroidobacteraceae bacterium]